MRGRPSTSSSLLSPCGPETKYSLNPNRLVTRSPTSNPGIRDWTMRPTAPPAMGSLSS